MFVYITTFSYISLISDSQILIYMFVSSENGLIFDVFNPLAAWVVRPLDFSFLKGASIFWSPSDHLFRFGMDELCPKYEEFSWLLRMYTKLPMAIPIEEIGPRNMLIVLLSIPQATCDYFIIGGLLDLRRMVNFFHRYEDMPSYCTGCTAATLICLVFDLLLVIGSTQVDPFIVPIVRGVHCAYCSS